MRLPITPPPLQNHGNYIISLNRFVEVARRPRRSRRHRRLHRVSRRTEILYRRRPRRRRAHRRSRHRQARRAEVRRSSPASTSARRSRSSADGVRGNLTKAAACAGSALDDGREPAAVYAIGIKELWEVPAGSPRSRARVIHTLGYPLRMEEFGGGFIYAMPDGRLSVGFVGGPRLPRSDVRSARRLPALQAASVRRVAARGRTDGALRRQGAARRRLAHDPAASTPTAR